ncbi:MAG: hypothetical protein ABF904_06295 [Ethanoligenens sp.]
MTVSQLAGLYWNTYQVSNNNAYKNQLSSDASAVQKRMGVQNLSAALSLPNQTGDLSGVSNLNTYVSSLYTRSQMSGTPTVSANNKASEKAWSSVSNLNTYAKSLYISNQLGLTASSANLNGVTTANQFAKINQLQSLLQSNPATLMQIYQNYLSDSFPGAIFSSVT